MDPILSLSFSINSSPGVYALMLGSGISRSANIPTGWKIVLDLCEKIAAAHGESTNGDPEQWYIQKFGDSPRYDTLLADVCKTPDERQALLKRYFEPSDEERESGEKLPTPAHKAIAWLVSEGYIRVILTTNFDPLLEMALQELGVSFDVASSDDALQGIRPLIHSNCTIIKLHGDYRDTRIKNTPEELKEYSEAMNRILDRVLDEFGLILAGWSAEWDEALKAAMYRSFNRRYSWYWLAVGSISTNAERLIQHRNAQVIRMSGADEFFVSFQKQVDSIATLKKPHPLTFDLALITSKKLISKNEKIVLQDYLNTESLNLRNKIIEMQFNDFKDFELQLDMYPNLTSKLLGLIIPLIAYGEEPYHHDLFKKVMNRIASLPGIGGSTEIIQLRQYPALLTMYTAGIVAVANHRFDWIKTILLQKGRYGSNEQNTISLIQDLHGYNVFEYTKTQLPDINKSITPESSFLYKVIHPFLSTLLPTEEEYRDAFDLFEWIMNLLYIHNVEHTFESWAPLGCYVWRRKFNVLAKDFIIEGKLSGVDWPLIRYCFDGDIEQFKKGLSHLDTFISSAKRPLNGISYMPLLGIYEEG
ncbi:hypothetical protein M2444_005656 [Paenibacillus sp. PastF-3]|uniref:SIR2 family protein n=1 Tax=Paenibacillus sp. PastF-3 TaxID=2940626 RepID=UPI0024746FAA|nr:SIR2 family protein [Paenibacillus sp. PastF-3]MDH6373813.1 hypothetical protein [Paenibacillus sp. PastF-3]